MGPPIKRGSWGNSSLDIRGANTFIKKDSEGGVHHFQGITEAGSTPLLRQQSSTHQGAAPCHTDLLWHQLPEALPCWMEILHLPCFPPGSRESSLQNADNTLAHCAVSQTCRLRLWDSVSVSPTDCSVCVCDIFLRLLECEQDINAC